VRACPLCALCVRVCAPLRTRALFCVHVSFCVCAFLRVRAPCSTFYVRVPLLVCVCPSFSAPISNKILRHSLVTAFLTMGCLGSAIVADCSVPVASSLSSLSMLLLPSSPSSKSSESEAAMGLLVVGSLFRNNF
jgi:hypothetical protein